MDKVERLYITCKTEKEFIENFIEDYISKDDDDQEILAKIFWLGRKKYIRIKKLNNIING